MTHLLLQQGVPKPRGVSTKTQLVPRQANPSAMVGGGSYAMPVGTFVTSYVATKQAEDELAHKKAAVEHEVEAGHKKLQLFQLQCEAREKELDLRKREREEEMERLKLEEYKLEVAKKRKMLEGSKVSDACIFHHWQMHGFGKNGQFVNE